MSSDTDPDEPDLPIAVPIASVAEYIESVEKHDAALKAADPEAYRRAMAKRSRARWN